MIKVNSIVENAQILIHNWMYNNRGEEPQFIYLGREEYRQLLTSNELIQAFTTNGGFQTFCGILIVKVCNDNYLMVGNANGIE